VAFLLILILCVVVMDRIQATWVRFDDAIRMAFEEGHEKEIEEYCPPDTSRVAFMFYVRSRRLLLERLNQSVRGYDKMDAERKEQIVALTDILHDLHKELGHTEPFNRYDPADELDDWFPFKLFASTMLGCLMVDLIEIKLATWLTITLAFLVSAVAVSLTQWYPIHIIVISAVTIASLVLGFGIPVYMARHRLEEKVQVVKLPGSKRNVVRAEEETVSDHGFVKLPGFLKVEEFPMVSLQLAFFFACYNCMRVVASNHYWYNHTLTTSFVLAGIIFAIPFLAFLLATVMISMALLMARGDLAFAGRQICWIFAITSRKLFAERREKSIRARHFKDQDQGPDENAEA